MESEVKDLDNLKQEECINTNGVQVDGNELSENGDEPSEETTDKSGIADSNNHIIISNDKEIFNASNNDAEYEAMIHGLEIAKDLEIKKLKVYSDS